MDSVNTEIEKTKKKIFIQRLENELSSDTVEHSGEHHEKIFGLHENLTTHKNSLGQLLSKAGDDVYMKKWGRLPEYHRLQKLREFSTTCQLSENETKLLKRCISKCTLEYIKKVEYDNVACCIKKITFIKKAST